MYRNNRYSSNESFRSSIDLYGKIYINEKKKDRNLKKKIESKIYHYRAAIHFPLYTYTSDTFTSIYINFVIPTFPGVD